MIVVEKILDMARGVYEQATEKMLGEHSIRVFISNASNSALVPAGPSHSASSSASVSFDILEPGKAGLVLLQGTGELGAALEFTLGAERLLLGAKRPLIGSASFCIEFSGTGNKRGPALLDFYHKMPTEFQGQEGTRACSQGEEYAAFAGQVDLGSQIRVHVLLGPQAELTKLPDPSKAVTSRSCIAPGAISSAELLDLAENCRTCREDLGRALLLLEVSSMQGGLGQLEVPDQAFALDLVAACFCDTEGLLGLPVDALRAELQVWHARRPVALGSEPCVKYELYAALRQSSPSAAKAGLEEYVDAALLLLKTAALQCAIALRDSMRLRASMSDEDLEGCYTNELRRAVSERWGSAHRHSSVMEETNCIVMEEHLRPDDRVDTPAPMPEDEVERVMAAAQQCIHDAADFTLRHSDLLDDIQAGMSDEVFLTKLRHFRARVPPMKRSFEPEEAEDRTFSHQCWGSELFASLDSGLHTSPRLVLESLGRGAAPYKSMSTNSKSGEFFFFSSDRRFLIKTVSEDEALLLFRMLSAYQDHIQHVPRSLIVRYAGLHRAQIPGHGLQYFSVMVSVFDPSCAVHETFDVKGSTLHRRSKDGESIGKDENWMDAGLRLRLPEDIRHQIREAHEQDSALLASHHVMDYSLLIGIHHRDRATQHADAPASSSSAPATNALAPSSALQAEGTDDLYFVGLIDFLIGFGIKKQAEHLLRVAQGHGKEASCVDPVTYAIRQVRFVQDCVLGEQQGLSEIRRRCKYGKDCYRKNPEHKKEFRHPNEEDWYIESRAAAGTVGVLEVSVEAAKGLLNREITGTSDPYAVVGLGLQRVSTPVVKSCLNPEWHTFLRLAVDQVHIGQSVEITVWDENSPTYQGSDSFMGRLRVPLADVIADSPKDISAKLEDVQGGTLNARMEFLRLDMLQGGVCENCDG